MGFVYELDKGCEKERMTPKFLKNSRYLLTWVRLQAVEGYLTLDLDVLSLRCLLSGSIQYTIGYRSFELRREVEEISFEGSSVYTRYSSLWDR